MRRSLVSATLVLTAILLNGCNCGDSQHESEAECKAVKPGEVTTVNHYCAVMLEDPVDPTLVREHKGQRVGFCCAGCFKRWDAMNDAQKDAAVAAAVAKGKP